MARLSALETGKKLVAEVRNFGDILWRFGLEILRILMDGLQVGFNWLFERGEKIYGSLEKRYAPVLRCWRGSLAKWWERRGWPPCLLRLIENVLLYLPIDIGCYLLNSLGGGSLGHSIPLNQHWLLAWLVFAGSVRACYFCFKEILPDRRKAARIETADNGI